ncbi:MAG: DUF427 domain-containing protein [Anaerolineae bacterium]
MTQAIWNGIVIAESDKTQIVEGNHYFPPEAIKKEFFQENSRHTVCPWKGTASYYDVTVDGKVKRAVAWYYPQPSQAAAHIKNHVAFYGSVKIVKEGEDANGGLLERIRGFFS